MTEMRYHLLALLIILSVVGCGIMPMACTGSSAESSSDSELLLDYGNGTTEWMEIKTGASVADRIISTLSAKGIVCSFSGLSLVVDGLETTTIGAPSTGGTTSVAGTTGITAVSSWHIFNWDSTAKEWAPLADPSVAYGGQSLAVAFYPDGILPVETPEYKTSWTMMYADAENSANQDAVLEQPSSSMLWSDYNEEDNGCYSSILYARGHIFVKYGDLTDHRSTLVSYNALTGEREWSFVYGAKMYETTTSLIVGQYIYTQSSMGYVFRFEWAEGPGEGNSNVTTFDGASISAGIALPTTTSPTAEGSPYGEGPTTMVADSGAIFFKAYSGMVYCYSLDLSLIWSYQMNGKTYFSAPTVVDDYVATGGYNGTLYLLDKHDGSEAAQTVVYRIDNPNPAKVRGNVNTPIMIGEPGNYTVFTVYDDGRGMNAIVSGLAIYSFDGTSLTKKADITYEEMGSVNRSMTRYITDSFKGVLVAAYNGIYTVDTEGNFQLINELISSTHNTHATPTLVNNELMFVNVYGKMYPNVYCIDTSGKTVGVFQRPYAQYSMTPVTVVDGLIFTGDDSGMFAYRGELPEYSSPVIVKQMELWMKLTIVLVIVLVAVAALWCILRFGLKWEKPFDELRTRVLTYFFGEEYSHNTKSKRKLHLVILVGLILTLIAAILSLCIGSENTMGVGQALSALVSSIQKGGHHLSYEELLIYNQRLPRVVAAFAVGIGLSVAGAIYQAVIKNPLVEPYIMGVSSGAGTFALAVLTFNFTFFGLFSTQSPSLIAFAAIFGGLLAFGCTMILAEKTGGKSINYVLAGIIIGLVFSAVQSLMMIQAGNKITSALSWLYGSFTSVTWNNVWLILIPCISLSLVPLIWAKELNLVLLGEDQARQMGLDAKKFDRLMLILASVLTAFCVAFCGIIGFVGLVIPHLSRMILGGDHRLMLPTSMAFGGLLLIFADLLSRMLLTGFELPVGAITTVIGVPVFAYLLVKRGKNYES